MTAAVDREEESLRRDEAASVLAALDEAYSLGLFRALSDADEPISVGELVERCEVAESTAYRKLARLRELGLVEKRERLRNDGRCEGYYALRADGVSVVFDDGDVDVTIRTASDE